MESSTNTLLNDLTALGIVGLSAVALMLFVLTVLVPWYVWRNKVYTQKIHGLLEKQNKILMYLARNKTPKPKSAKENEPVAPLPPMESAAAEPQKVSGSKDHLKVIEKDW